MRRPFRPRLRHRLRSAAIVCAGVVALFAAVPACAAPDVPPRCGTVVIPAGLGFSSPDAIATLHPLFGNGLELAISTLLFRPLVVINDAHGIDPVASLAETVTPDPDDEGFAVTLKPARWSDGVPVTTSDVLYTWGLIKALGPAYLLFGQGGMPGIVRSITATDARHFHLRLAHRVNAAWFAATALTQIVPFPAHDWGRLSLAQQQSAQSRASFYRTVDGPFLLRSLVLGRDAVFVPNPGYTGPPVPYARLVLRSFPGGNPLEALRTGEIDAATLPPLFNGPRGPEIGRFARVRLPPSWLDWAIVPNLADPSAPFLRDPVVRVAMTRAIDQRRLITVALGGDGEPQHGFVPTAWTSFLPPVTRTGDPALDFDPVAAEAALDRAGWRRPRPGGIRTKDGRTLAFSVLVDVDSDTSLLMMQVVQAELAAVGIRMRIEAVAFSQMLARAVGPADGWDAILFSQPSSPYPDASAALLTGSGNNYGRFSDRDTDRLIAAASMHDDRSTLWALERRVEAEQPVLFLPAPVVTLLARSDLRGVDRVVDTVGNWWPERLRPTGCEAP